MKRNILVSWATLLCIAVITLSYNSRIILPTPSKNEFNHRFDIEKSYIVDITMYNGEAILETRLELLYDVVDYFYITESNVSFTGEFFKPEGLWKDRNAEILKPYRKKIRWITTYVDDDDIKGSKKTEDIWTREQRQRYEFIKQARKDFPQEVIDKVVAIQSDVDELVDPELVKEFRPGGEWHNRVTTTRSDLVMKMFYYNFNHNLGYWRVAMVGPGRQALYNETLMRTARDKRSSYIPDAGWHGSYFMPIDRIRQKIQHFSHQEYNKDPFINLDHIQECVREGKDLFNRENSHFSRFDPTTLPEPVLKLHERICKEQNVPTIWMPTVNASNASNAGRVNDIGRNSSYIFV